MTPGDDRAYHVRLGPGINTLSCLRCGETYRVNLPAPFRLYLAMAKAFERDHRGCEPRATGETEARR